MEPDLLAHASAELVLAGLFQPRLADALIGFIVGRRPLAAGPDAATVWCHYVVWLWAIRRFAADASAELVLAGLFQPRLADALIGFIVGRRPLAAGPDAATVRCHHMVWLWAIRCFAADASAELVLAGLFQPRLADALIGFIVGRRPFAAGPDAATVRCHHMVWLWAIRCFAADASAELVLAGLFQPRLADALIGFIVGRRPLAAGPDAATVRCHHMVWLWAIRRFAADASAELVLAGLFQPRLADALIGFIVGRRPLAAGPDAATVLCQYVVWRRTCRLCAHLYCVCKR